MATPVLNANNAKSAAGVHSDGVTISNCAEPMAINEVSSTPPSADELNALTGLSLPWTQDQLFIALSALLPGVLVQAVKMAQPTLQLPTVPKLEPGPISPPHQLQPAKTQSAPAPAPIIQSAKPLVTHTHTHKLQKNPEVLRVRDGSAQRSAPAVPRRPTPGTLQQQPYKQQQQQQQQEKPVQANQVLQPTLSVEELADLEAVLDNVLFMDNNDTAQLTCPTLSHAQPETQPSLKVPPSTQHCDSQLSLQAASPPLVAHSPQDSTSSDMTMAPVHEEDFLDFLALDGDDCLDSINQPTATPPACQTSGAVGTSGAPAVPGKHVEVIELDSEDSDDAEGGEMRVHMQPAKYRRMGDGGKTSVGASTANTWAQPSHAQHYSNACASMPGMQSVLRTSSPNLHSANTSLPPHTHVNSNSHHTIQPSTQGPTHHINHQMPTATNSHLGKRSHQGELMNYNTHTTANTINQPHTGSAAGAPTAAVMAPHALSYQQQQYYAHMQPQAAAAAAAAAMSCQGFYSAQSAQIVNQAVMYSHGMYQAMKPTHANPASQHTRLSTPPLPPYWM